MHYLVFVIIPAATLNIKVEVTRLLSGSEAAPEKVFPDYAAPCSCIDSWVLMECYKQFDATAQGLAFKTQLASARDTKNKMLEEETLQARRQAVHQLEQAHPQYQTVDPGCDICAGAGTYASSRNPRSHWDYWAIGGRWGGFFQALPPTTATPDAELRHNTAPVKSIPQAMQPAALVTPEGHWYAGPLIIGEDKFQDFISAHEKQERAAWTQQVAAIFQQCANDVAVVVDCHF